MALDASVNFTQTRNQLILDAFQILGVYGVGRTVSAEDMSFAVSMLNKMVKAYMAQGLHLFTKVEGILFLNPTTPIYDMGNTAMAANASGVNISSTTIALTTGNTSVTMISTAGMVANDNIGIVIAPATPIFWTTVASVTNSTQLVLSAGVPSNIASGAYVYDYTTGINKPMRVSSCRRAQYIGDMLNEVPMAEIAYMDYMNMPLKYNGGLPNQWSYNPNDTEGMMYLWQMPNDVTQRVHFTYDRMIDDLDNVSDNFDFPSEWLEPLTWQLAVRLGPAFGKDNKVKNSILPIASNLLELIKSYDNEIGSLYFRPDKT